LRNVIFNRRSEYSILYIPRSLSFYVSREQIFSSSLYDPLISRFDFSSRNAVQPEQEFKKQRPLSVHVQRRHEGGHLRERDVRRGGSRDILQALGIVEMRRLRRQKSRPWQETQHQQRPRLESCQMVAESDLNQRRSLRVRDDQSGSQTGEMLCPINVHDENFLQNSIKRMFASRYVTSFRFFNIRESLFGFCFSKTCESFRLLSLDSFLVFLVQFMSTATCADTC